MFGQENNKKSIVLDLDHCVVHAITDSDSGEILSLGMKPENIKHRGRIAPVIVGDQSMDFCVVKRPHVDLLLSRIRPIFDNVGVWTAGMPDYAEKLAKEIFKDHYPPDFLLTRDHVLPLPGSTNPRESHKPLRVIDNLHPGMLDPRFTLIIDDTPHNFLENPGNGVTIPPFVVERPNLLADEDRHILHLVNWFSSPEFTQSKDYRLLDKSKIFTGCSGAGCPKCRVDIQPQKTEHRLLFSLPPHFHI